MMNHLIILTQSLDCLSCIIKKVIVLRNHNKNQCAISHDSNQFEMYPKKIIITSCLLTTFKNRIVLLID